MTDTQYETLDYTVDSANISVHLVLSYDASQPTNPDGSVTVTGASGTYSQDGSLLAHITGIDPANGFGAQDNELWVDGTQPVVTDGGISYTTDYGGGGTPPPVNLYYEDSHYHDTFAPNFDGTTLVTSLTESPNCFRRGTHILTPDGEAAIEDLRIGDRIVTASGAARMVRWIGHRFHAAAPENDRHRPIRIAAGALGRHLPHRDLYVSPRHALLLDDVLVEARWLLNGATITQPPMTRDVEYFHIELDSHDALVAEGAPSESLMGANRHQGFDNGAEFAALYPNASPASNLQAFAPRVEDGFAFQAIRDRLYRRAA